MSLDAVRDIHALVVADTGTRDLGGWVQLGLKSGTCFRSMGATTAILPEASGR